MKAKLTAACVLSFCVAALAVAAPLAIQDGMKPDKDGFIRDWLILAPIPANGDDNGAAEVVREQIKGEGAMQPKAGDKASIEKKDYVWKAVKLDDFFIDFAKLAPARTEDVIGYAVAYVTAEEEKKDVAG